MHTAQEPVSIEEAVRRLSATSPAVPLLALGQTVFWDETVKAGVALAAERTGLPYFAGVHDTDYFAKLPGAERGAQGYRAFPHNDHSTKGLWSAAGEFSALFGSETVVRREALQAAGVKLERIALSRPGILDEATEAWGWRGIVSLSEDPPIAGEVPLGDVFTELRSTFDWALESSLASFASDRRRAAGARADGLRDLVNQTRDRLPHGTLGDFYEALIEPMYARTASGPVPLQTTRTSRLLRFNRSTCRLPRFQTLDLFLRPETAEAARAAYDEAIAGSEMYALERFGTCAIPFDLIVPGRGRGTLRVGPNGVVVMARKPLFVTLEEPVRSVEDLAAAVEGKFGPGCTVVGKAVTLIGMLAREFAFVFHEGASGYVWRSRGLHQRLRALDPSLDFNPILRVRYETWDALGACKTWFSLPEPFRRPFGADDVYAPTFAARWREVVEDQAGFLTRLGALRRPIELIRFLAEYSGGGWASLAREYEALHDGLERLRETIDGFRAERRGVYDKIRALRGQRVAAEAAKGAHFRDRVFEREPTEEDLVERTRLTGEVEAIVHRLGEQLHRLHESWRRQREFVTREEVRAMHERRRIIELEAELKRLRLARQGLIVHHGLKSSNRRPSGWWFPLLCPEGKWFHETMRTATAYLEPLQ
ncbi:MAG: hypothetical protein KIS66_05140 [Fimbriimonadaceae bacterium]|nr:hypothetical protein [Fimbriimonadaceae bacterium]